MRVSVGECGCGCEGGCEGECEGEGGCEGGVGVRVRVGVRVNAEGDFVDHQQLQVESRFRVCSCGRCPARLSVM